MEFPLQCFRIDRSGVLTALSRALTLDAEVSLGSGSNPHPSDEYLSLG
jgi:hypothetical protein